MKTRARVMFYALSFGLVPFSYAFGQNMDMMNDAPVQLTDEELDSAVVSDSEGKPIAGGEEAAEAEEEEEEDAAGADVEAAAEIEEDAALETETEAETEADVEDGEEEEDAVLSLDQAKELIKSLPGAKDAVTGEVETEVPQEIYDIYGRQLAYREGSKEYRKSLEKRRDNFAKPRTEMVNRYKDAIQKVYEAESAAYQEDISEEDDEEGAANGEAADAAVGAGNDAFSEGALKEQTISADDSGELVNKRVVTSFDAPEFDPAKLGNEDEAAASVQVEAEEEVVAKEVEVKVNVSSEEQEPAQGDVIDLQSVVNTEEKAVKAADVATDVAEEKKPEVVVEAPEIRVSEEAPAPAPVPTSAPTVVEEQDDAVTEIPVDNAVESKKEEIKSDILPTLPPMIGDEGGVDSELPAELPELPKL